MKEYPTQPVTNSTTHRRSTMYIHVRIVAYDIGLLSNEVFQLNLPPIRVSQIRTTLSALAEATKLLISLRWMQ